MRVTYTEAVKLYGPFTPISFSEAEELDANLVVTLVAAGEGAVYMAGRVRVNRLESFRAALPLPQSWVNTNVELQDGDDGPPAKRPRRKKRLSAGQQEALQKLGALRAEIREAEKRIRQNRPALAVGSMHALRNKAGLLEEVLQAWFKAKGAVAARRAGRR